MLVTPRDRLAGGEPLVNRQGIYRRLYKKGVAVMTLTTILPTSRFEDGSVTLAHTLTGKETVVENVALLTYATPRVPNDSLAAPLRAAGVEVHLVGDCLAPRYILNATAEGHRIGSAL